MCAVGGGGGQHHFTVARELDLAIVARPVGERDATNFRALARHHDDLGAGVDAAIGSGEDGAIGGERSTIVRRRRTHGLVCRRPHCTGHDVADVNPLSGRVARAVGAPAEDVHLTAAAVSASRVREQHTVRLATEQPDARLRRVRRVELARDRERSWRAHERIRGRIGLRGPRGVAARHPLVEQQCGRAHGGITQEPALPDPLPPLEIERVVQREHRHADVVRHRCANDGGTIGEGLGPRIIDCVEEPIRSVCTDALEHRQIAQRLVRRDGEGERARIRGDNELAAESALERKIGDAERTVLIRIVPIAHVVRGFGKAPRHAARVSVGNLSPHCGPMRLIEQRERPRWHHEHRHEVLEHASTPRHERRAGVSRRERPAEVEPVLDRHVVLRHGDEARKPRLGGEQIVGTGIESSGACIVAEGEEAPLFVVEQREIHCHRQCTCSATDVVQAQRVGALLLHKRLAGR